MSIAQRISEDEYQRIVLAEPLETWELYDGQLREKPGMTWDHDEIVLELSHLLRSQLGRRQFRVRVEGRVRRPGTIFRPDVVVVPALISRGTVSQEKIPADLAGLPVIYSGDALLPHSGLARWIETRVAAMRPELASAR